MFCCLDEKVLFRIYSITMLLFLYRFAICFIFLQKYGKWLIPFLDGKRITRNKYYISISISSKAYVQSNKYKAPSLMKTYTIAFVLFLIASTRAGPWIALPCAVPCLALIFPGAIAGCVASLCGPLVIACFDDETTVISQKGVTLLSHAQVGDLVLTSRLDGQLQWTKVKMLVSNESEHEFVKITTSNKELSVTTDHVMLSEHRLVKAKDLKVGAKLGQETIQQLQFYRKKNRITVLTESGTILANNVLTTTICGDYLDATDSAPEAIEKWKKDHQWVLGQ